MISKSITQKLTYRERDFFDSLDKLNSIRNRVAHPCKDLPVDEDDFLFVKDFASSLGLLKPKIPTVESIIKSGADHFGSLEAFKQALRDLLRELGKRRERKMTGYKEKRAELEAKVHAELDAKGESGPLSGILKVLEVQRAVNEEKLWEKTESELKAELEAIRKAFWSGGTHAQES